MHIEYIVSSRNLDKKLHVPLWSQGPHLRDIFMMVCFISFCVVFTMWMCSMMCSKCKFHI